MLKHRLIPCILVRDGLLVQSIGFKRYLPIGKPKIAVEYFNRWDVDEIIVLDISRSRRDIAAMAALIRHMTSIAFVPVTVGGGITAPEQVEMLLAAGVEKTSINSQAVRNPDLVARMARVFGSQEVVVSIDALLRQDGSYEVMIDGGRTPTGLSPPAWALQVQGLGAGEILLNAIHRDGMKNGFDTALIASVSDAVSIPVIAMGGAGAMEHFPAAILEGGADAVCAANIFQYYEHSTIKAKVAMRQAGIPVRMGTAVRYENAALHGVPKHLAALGDGYNRNKIQRSVL